MKNEKTQSSLETLFKDDLLLHNAMYFLRGGDGDEDDTGGSNTGTGNSIIIP